MGIQRGTQTTKTTTTKQIIMKFSRYLQAAILFKVTGSMQHVVATDEPSKLLSSLTDIDSINTSSEEQTLIHRSLQRLRRRRRRRRHRRPRPESSTNTTCPERSPDVACTMMYAPVNCNDCVYSNLCIARSAGFGTSSCEPT
jgi:hypothetical protein